MLPTLSGRLVTLRPAHANDAATLARILAEPAVERWWGAHDLEKVRREILDEGDGWVIVADGETRGWIEFSKDPEPRYRRVDLDIFIATALHGRGHAREALRLVIRHFIDRGHHRFTIDPAVANERAIGAYASLGFRPVGTMRRYERADDGVWHDNLLMDLLAEELRE